MAPNEKSPDQDSPGTAETEPEEKHEHRKHGYRGYPNKPDAGGGVHWGSGFAGVGSTGGPGGASLPEPGIVSEKTQESVEEEAEEEEEK